MNEFTKHTPVFLQLQSEDWSTCRRILKLLIENWIDSVSTVMEQLTWLQDFNWRTIQIAVGEFDWKSPIILHCMQRTSGFQASDDYGCIWRHFWVRLGETCHYQWVLLMAPEFIYTLLLSSFCDDTGLSKNMKCLGFLNRVHFQWINVWLLLFMLNLRIWSNTFFQFICLP